MALSICDSKTNSQGRELLEHGTALFPVSCYDDNLNSVIVPWHWHDELEALIVSEGNAIISAGKKRYIVKQGEGFFINAGLLHAVQIGTSPVSRIHSVVFHPRLIGGSIDSIFWQNYVHQILANPTLSHLYFDGSCPWHQNAIQNIQTAWHACAEEQPGYEFQVRFALSQLIFHLSTHHPIITKRPSEKALRENERLKTMLHFIQEHYFEQLNIAMIASTAMISQSECLRCFRSMLGLSPIKYLKQFRIQKASEYLITTDDKIIDVGMNCGFQDVSYFIKSFRELKGCTPADYRKNVIFSQK